MAGRWAGRARSAGLAGRRWAQAQAGCRRVAGASGRRGTGARGARGRQTRGARVTGAGRAALAHGLARAVHLVHLACFLAWFDSVLFLSQF